MKLLRLALIVACIPFAAHAEGESLKMQQLQQKQNDQLAEYVKYPNEKCGITFSHKIDYTNITEADFSAQSISGYCEEAFSAIAGLCDDATAKASIQKNVKGVTCSAGKERKISLDGGMVNYTMQWDAANNSDYVKEFLLNNLK